MSNSDESGFTFDAGPIVKSKDKPKENMKPTYKQLKAQNQKKKQKTRKRRRDSECEYAEESSSDNLFSDIEANFAQTKRVCANGIGDAVDFEDSPSMVFLPL